MTNNVLPVQLGVVTLTGGPASIIAQVSTGSLAQMATVTLSAPYNRQPAPGYPTPDAGSPANPLALSQYSFTTGSTLTLFSDEAAALVAAGAAAYA